MEKIPKEFVTTMEAMKAVCVDLFDQFVYTLDVAHCDSEDEALSTLQNYRSRISKLHISNRKGPKFHTPLNEGDYDMEKLLPELARYTLPMVIEGLDSSRDFSTAKQNIRFIQNIFNGGNQNEKEICSNFNRRTRRRRYWPGSLSNSAESTTAAQSQSAESSSETAGESSQADLRGSFPKRPPGSCPAPSLFTPPARGRYPGHD